MRAVTARALGEAFVCNAFNCPFMNPSAACVRVARIVALALLSWAVQAEAGAGAGAEAARVPRHAQATSPSLVAVDDLPCPPGVPNVVGTKFKGPLVNTNFNRRQLVNADFSGVTLDGVVFIGADLRGANFSGATFLGSKTGFPNDFTLAKLTNACFRNAHFVATAAPTYFSHADFSGADFSSTDLTGGHVVLGPPPLAFDRTAARPRFRKTTMTCEFVAQWAALDLSGALGLKACASRLLGANLSGAQLSGVDLSGIDLSRTAWAGADLSGVNFQSAILDGATGLSGAVNTDLSGAQFNSASARYVDFHAGKLGGANFSGADLEATDFSGAVFADASLGAAKFDYAHLKNANFARTNLNSVTFNFASLYGSAIGVPPALCQLAATKACSADYPQTGATCSCASASGANLTRANFGNAFLFGVDFSSTDTIVNGTIFSSAILVAANFSGATFTVDPSQGGAAPKFDKAWLQGAQLPGANLNGSTLDGAYVDVGVNTAGGNVRTGNALHVLLTNDYTSFPNWRGSATPCVRLRYDKASVLPTDIGTMTCPYGRSIPGVGCGALLRRDPNVPTNPAWFGKSVNTNSPVPGWYVDDSTYELKTTGAAVCSGAPEEKTWFPANPPK